MNHRERERESRQIDRWRREVFTRGETCSSCLTQTATTILSTPCFLRVQSPSRRAVRQLVKPLSEELASAQQIRRNRANFLCRGQSVHTCVKQGRTHEARVGERRSRAKGASDDGPNPWDYRNVPGYLSGLVRTNAREAQWNKRRT